MDKQKKQLLNDHAGRYIREVMVDQLQARGYVSLKDEGLHWYRLINGNVVQAVYFYSQWAALPILMGIAYGCHPLFIAPEYPKSIHMGSMMRSVEAVNPGRMIMKQANRACYSSNIAVTCPDDQHQGADILSDILSRMDSTQDLKACYLMHKQSYIDTIRILNLPVTDIFSNISSDFMNEVVFMDDRELYPYCVRRIESEIQRYEKAQKVRKLWNIEKTDYEVLNRLKLAVIDGKRDQHLEYLRQQEEIHLLQLKKKVKCSGV